MFLANNLKCLYQFDWTKPFTVMFEQKPLRFEAMQFEVKSNRRVFKLNRFLSQITRFFFVARSLK